MSYRITARGHELGKDYDGGGEIHCQVYGNNESPKLLEDYLRSRGVKFDGDGCFRDYEVEDINALFDVMLEIQSKQVEDDTYYDFKPPAHMDINTPEKLFRYWDYKLDVAIVLVMYNFYKRFEKLLESYWDYETGGVKYKIKDGKHIYLSGF